jgi:hypothetical protein
MSAKGKGTIWMFYRVFRWFKWNIWYKCAGATCRTGSVETMKNLAQMINHSCETISASQGIIRAMEYGAGRPLHREMQQRDKGSANGMGIDRQAVAGSIIVFLSCGAMKHTDTILCFQSRDITRIRHVTSTAWKSLRISAQICLRTSVRFSFSEFRQFLDKRMHSERCAQLCTVTFLCWQRKWRGNLGQTH